MTSLGKRWDVPSRQKYANVITREVLSHATKEKISDYKLADMLHVPFTAIQYYRIKWGIKSGCPHRGFGLATAHLRKKTIPEDVIGCIVGGVLGDGSLSRNPQKSGVPLAYLAIVNGLDQLEWIAYKKKRLGWLVKMPLRISHRKTTFTPHGITFCCFSTVNHPKLGELRALMYDEKGRKRITAEVLELLTPEGFVWWFFDDGSCSRHRGRAWVEYTLSVGQFTLAEAKLISEALFRKFGLRTSVRHSTNKKTGRVYPTLYFNAATRDRLKDLLRMLPVKCMQYKIDPSVKAVREAPSKGDEPVHTPFKVNTKQNHMVGWQPAVPLGVECL